MTTENPFLTKVDEIAASVKAIKENSATKAELDEKYAKLTADVELLSKQAKDHISRVGTPGEYKPSAVQKMLKRGVKSFCDRAETKPHFINTRAVGSVYKQAPSGHLIDEKRLDQDEIELLELADTVKLIDCATAGMLGEQWSQEKAQYGERTAFLNRFPEVGKQWDSVVTDLRKAVQAKVAGQMDTTATGQGVEWIPTVWGQTMFDQVRLECPEANFIPHYTMPAPTWKWPGKVNVVPYYKKAEAGNAQLGNPTTTAVTFTAKLGAAYTTYTDEVDEDSIIAMVPMLRADIMRGILEGISIAIMNGSTQATHFDADLNTGPSYSSERLVNGWRQYALDGSVANTYDASPSATAVALSTAGVLGAMVGMGKYAAARVNEVGLFVGVRDWIRLLADSNLITVQNRGPSATILSGQIGSIATIPVLISHAMNWRTTCGFATVASVGVAATGKGTGTYVTPTGAEGTSILVNRNAWAIGDRRVNTLETWKNIQTGVNHIVATNRWDLQPIYQPTSYPTSAAFDATAQPHTRVIISTLQ